MNPNITFSLEKIPKELSNEDVNKTFSFMNDSYQDDENKYGKSTNELTLSN